MNRRNTGALACALVVASLVASGGVAHAGVGPARTPTGGVVTTHVEPLATPAETVVVRTAVEPLEPSVSVRVGRRVAWVVVDLPSVDAGRVRMDVLTPLDALGGRRTWQWCEIDYVGPGRYRCGVDVRRRTGARALAGAWQASAALDGVLLGVVPFSVT